MTALQAIGDLRPKPKPQPPPVTPGATPVGGAAATPGTGGAGTPTAAGTPGAAAATAQRATPVAIPLQGIQIMLPGGQTIVSFYYPPVNCLVFFYHSHTFTRTHLAHLQRLSTMHHQGQALTVEQRQMMTTLYSQYSYIQKLHSQQQQQLANAQAAGMPPFLSSPHLISALLSSLLPRLLLSFSIAN